MRTLPRFVFVVVPVFALIVSTTIASCQSWKHNVTIGGITYTKARSTDTGVVIGYIQDDRTIDGRLCRKGWVHVFPNGTPAAFMSAAPITLNHFEIPPGTWVFQNSSGVITVCSFPHDVEIQGHVCRGGMGGSEGVQTAFYPNGALKQFFPNGDVVVDGVPCGSSPFRPGIELHENGRLHSATLSRDFAIQGRNLAKGTRIRLSPTGSLVSN